MDLIEELKKRFLQTISFPLNQKGNWDFTLQNKDRFKLISFPIVFITALISDSIPLLKLILGTFNIWLHELGHALCYWLASIPAIPISFGPTHGGVTFSLSHNPSIILFLILFSTLFYFSLMTLKFHFIRFLILITLSLLIIFTLFYDKNSHRVITSFMGVGGEIILGTLLIVSFFHKMPSSWNWKISRWPLLVIGAFTLGRATFIWNESRISRSLKPHGGNFSQAGSFMGLDGDLYKLIVDYSVPMHKIISYGFQLCSVAWAIIALHYIYYNFYKLKN